MSKQSDPFNVEKRKNLNSYRLTISATSGLPYNIYTQWQRKSFKNMPDVLAIYRYPRNMAEAKRGRLHSSNTSKKNQNKLLYHFQVLINLLLNMCLAFGLQRVDMSKNV